MTFGGPLRTLPQVGSVARRGVEPRRAPPSPYLGLRQMFPGTSFKGM